MISCAISNRRSYHGYLTNNESSSHGDPVNSAIATRKPKTVYIGKNRYPIYIIQLAEVLEIAWRKKSGFVLITYSVDPLRGGHSVSDLITIMDNEVPMDTHSKFQDSEKKR